MSSTVLFARIRMRRIAALCTLIVAVLLFSGCGAQETPAPEPTAEPIPTYSVRFYLKDKLLLEDTLQEGSTAEPVVISRAGLRFLGWMDAVGDPVNPEEHPVTGNTSYFASAYPDLSRHVPYLFPDALGFLRPDAPLTARELADAVEALAVPEAAPYLPYLPRTDEAVSPARFREILAQLFPEDEANEVSAALSDQETVSRSEAARCFNALLGRSEEEIITLRRGAALPPDLPAERADYVQLLEAAVSHTPDEWGERWTECSVEPRYAPGVCLLNGALYCFDENGILLTDTEQDGFTFGPDGRYTSGNEELDGYVEAILQTIVSQKPDAERLTYLRDAYDYCRDSFTYLRKAPFVYGETGWEIAAAIEMFSTELGNCYNYAATFWSLSRALGYDARIYSGTVGTDRSPHGWVEIEFDGENYVFDTELEMAYRKKGNYNNDMFMMPRLMALNWSYRRPQTTAQ